jgi:hypothetical protein
MSGRSGSIGRGAGSRRVPRALRILTGTRF